ncbi:DUF2510 domain-containing protein [Kitasatospora sp. NPDC017646]|uniref:DUF2510 domain-containing protein n=1 Tax=Kitasatospora sp. NPDC017646 TaxID=3364024 RepID=UPI00379D7885
MSEQIPAGWYPDPKDTTSDPRPQRWWDGKGWTADTRPAPSDAPQPEPPAAAAPGPGTAEQPRVLEGEVLDSGPTVRYPEPPPFGTAYGAPAQPPRKAWRKPSRLVVATAVAAVLGLGAGSGITYLAMDGKHDGGSQRSAARVQPAPKDGGDGLFGFPGLGGGNGGGTGGGNGGGNGGGGGNGSGKARPGANKAIDMVNGLVLPVPSGWQAGTTDDGYAALTVGDYKCPDGKACSLGGANTGRIDGGGTDAQAAAKADIDKAAKDAYGDITGHQELKSEAVKVNGQDGYLVRWKVNAAKGNNGYVETVVFPSTDGKNLVSVHFGFDIADKAPDVGVMDTIVKGIADFKGKVPGLPGMPGSGGSGGGSGSGGSSPDGSGTETT